MNIPIKNKEGNIAGQVTLSSVFQTPVREDLILRANLALRSHQRQPYGADPRAGAKSAAKLSRRRRKYKTAYGHGISRVPRKILSRNGIRMNWVGAFAPGMVGGRRAYPPQAEKVWTEKINDKERKLAIKSALAATVKKECVTARGHKIPTDYPFALSNDFETLDKTSKVKEALEKLGLTDELIRCAVRKIRAGKGKNRGRPYIHKKGPLIVVSGPCKLLDSAQNIPGIDVVSAQKVNTLLLAPGSKPGRLTLYTQGACTKL